MPLRSFGRANAVVIRRVGGVERVRLPTDYKWFTFFGVALLFATAAAGHRNSSELTDLTGFALLAAVMLMIIDSEVWLLAVLSLGQQLTKSYGRTFGGLAVITPDGNSMRRERWLGFGLIAVMFVVVVYTLSRGALVATAVAAIAALPFRGVPIWKVGVAAGCVAVGGLLFLPPTVQNRFAFTAGQFRQRRSAW